MDLPNPRRLAIDAAKKYLLDGIGDPLGRDEAVPARAGEETLSRLTPHNIKRIKVSRSRERILANLDEMYREAFERAKTTGDESQMAALDFAYRREQLYFEILLDIRENSER